jgi:hypothetical protein
MVDLAGFPVEGWRYDGSFSYGQDELFQGLRKVVTKVFTTYDAAQSALRVLQRAKVKTARLTDAQHVDGRTYYYVFAERTEFLKFRDLAIPNLKISGKA